MTRIQNNPANGAENRDLTGRRDMVSNVLASWGGQFIFIIAGFVLPRLIDRNLGQSLLGIWDFSWSLVSYFGLVQVGIVASISRYVAMHQANGDQPALNRAVSSVSCVLLLMASIIALLTIGAVALMGTMEKDALGDHLADARWVVLFLGLEMAVQTVFSGYGGVITGCHRWGIHNAISAGSYFLTVVGMIVALLMGGGLRTMAVIHFSSDLASWVARFFIAYRICPGLSVRVAHATRKTALEMFNFGAKSWIPGIADMILNQTTNVLIAACMGPAALAVYARSRNLVKCARDLVTKMAAILVTSASSLHAAGEQEAIQELVIKATRYSAFLTLPITMLLAISGGPLLQLWMGTKYANPWLPAILAVGHAGAILQLPVWAILAGMNRHGRLAIANTVCNLLAAIGVVCVLSWLKLGLAWVAFAGTWPLVLVNLFYAPMHICRRTGLPVGKYFKRALLFPMWCMFPFILCLIGARILFADRPTLSLLSGAGVGGLLLVPVYWRHVIPHSMKQALLRRIRMIWPGFARPRAASLAPANTDAT